MSAEIIVGTLVIAGFLVVIGGLARAWGLDGRTDTSKRGLPDPGPWTPPPMPPVKEPRRLNSFQVICDETPSPEILPDGSVQVGSGL